MPVPQIGIMTLANLIKCTDIAYTNYTYDYIRTYFSSFVCALKNVKSNLTCYEVSISTSKLTDINITYNIM